MNNEQNNESIGTLNQLLISDNENEKSEILSKSQLEILANKNKIKKNSTESKISDNSKSKSNNTTVEKKKHKKKEKKRSRSLSLSSSTNAVDKIAKENNNDKVRREKNEYLVKISKIHNLHKWTTLSLSINNSLDEIRGEYERITYEIQNEKSVAFYKNILLLSIQGIEFLNNRFDPMGIDLDGWSQSLNYSLENQEYDSVIQELAEKYKIVSTMSPELKLLGMLVGSAVVFSTTKQLAKVDTSNILANLISGLNKNQQTTQQNPQFKRQNNIITESSADDDTSIDILPSKINDPELENINIDNILKTMKERKEEDNEKKELAVPKKRGRPQKVVKN